jgi:sporulenol synthase
MLIHVQEGMNRLVQQLIKKQSQDGAWRFCFESGVMTDAYMIIILRTLQMADEDSIRTLHSRIMAKQEHNGAWKVYPDEKEGNLSATVEAYFALLYSGYSKPTDDHIKQVKQFILSHGGIRNVDSLMTKVILASTGQYPWPNFFPLPVELILIPTAAPIDFFEFSGYARVHLAPVMLIADKKFVIRNEKTPDLSDLYVRGASPDAHRIQPYRSNALFEEMKQFVQKLLSLPGHIHQLAVKKTEQYMLDRIESDGTLYSYASATFLMIFALLSLNYDKRHPIIMNAVKGLTSLICQTDRTSHVQNSTSTVWDTALISHVLQESGLHSEHSTIHSAGKYLLSRQHARLGDWSRNVRNPVPGGWGFSDINTINPDVDDTTAALRAIRKLATRSMEYREAFNKGLQWVLSMQNDDGGWPAFEKNTDNPILTMLPLNGADAAAIDPSTADLTGRTLDFLGNDTGLSIRHPFVRRAVRWLQEHQEDNGSWYGRWGICYIYGTWAALTGLLAVGESPEQPAIRRGVNWLLSIQNMDGGWGESCESDQEKKYISLGYSTLSQTSWALDALISAHPEPNAAIDKGVRYLLNSLNNLDQADYPTGAGLPGQFYIRYHSYPYIWPLLALSHYMKKYNK